MTGGTFPGDLERPDGTHTRHCFSRMKHGDGECECGYVPHAGMELKALERFEQLWEAIRSAKLSNKDRSTISGLLNGIEQSYKRLSKDRDEWRNAMACQPRKDKG